MFEFLKDSQKWQLARESDEYKPLRDILFDLYNTYCKDKPIPYLPYSLWLSTVKTGIRKQYDTLYLHRRYQLGIYLVLYMLYPENSEYLDKIHDIVAEICQEYSWCLPVHLRPNELNNQRPLDLYACETGFYLAEIKYILGDKLSDLLAERITALLKYRIIDCVKEIPEFYENNKTNWAAVCAGSCAMVMMYEDPDSYYEVQHRIDKSMESYLDGIDDDGFVGEGPGYWGYGFGFYIMYADMLRRFTNGKVDKLKSPKVARIAKFYSNMCMSNDCVYSYADGSKELDYCIAGMYFLNKEFGTDIPSLEYAGLGVDKVAWMLRSFLFFDPNIASQGINNDTTYYKNSQLYITRRDKYAFGVSASNNKPGHNHLDIGSFVLVSDNKHIFTDLGPPLYTKHSLSIEGYSDTLERMSQGHSVPIVNGVGQGLGEEFYGKMSVSDNDISIDLKSAYPAKIEKLMRKIKLCDDKVIIRDEFDKSAEITERFITEIEPEISADSVRVDCITVRFSKGMQASCKPQETFAHSGKSRTVYLLDFIKKSDCDFAEFEFLIDKNATRNGK